MSYQTDWLNLSVATDLIAKTNAVSQGQARAELSRAISDQAVRIRARLDRHSTGHQTLSITVNGDQLEIPATLSAIDIDWEKSRPVNSWRVGSIDRHRPGYWFIKDLEVHRSDIEAKLLRGPKHSSDRSEPDRGAKRKKREAPALTAAQDAIRKLFPEGLPPQHELLNTKLVDRVIKYLEKYGGPPVSPSTILRAAGRRK